jgi:hypothetical protein
MGTTYYHTVNGEIVGETTSGVRTDYLVDALGSVTGTVNQSAQVLNTYRYKPYGALPAKTGTAADPKSQWVGTLGYRATSRAQSDYYVRARHYGSVPGRWTTVDPLWPLQPGSAYSTPTSAVDPSGLDPCPPIVDLTEQDILVQMMHLSWDKRNAERIDDCIQKAAQAGHIQCDHFRQSTILCLTNNPPYIDCQYDCNGNEYAYTVNPPTATVCTGHGTVYDVVICMSLLMAGGRGASYLPNLQHTANQALWVTILHESLHACAYHHGRDLLNPGYEPTPDRTCNEIAVCCIDRVISGKPTQDCARDLPAQHGGSGVPARPQ